MKAFTTLFLGAALVLGMAVPALAQTPADVTASTRVQEKFRKLELLNFTLPVLLTQKQIRGVLPLLEKARKADSDLKGKEADILRGLEKDCDAAILAGTTKRLVIPTTLMDKINKSTAGMTIARQIMIQEHVTAVFNYINTALEPSQKKVAANLIPGSWVNPKEPEKATEEEKLNRWVTLVIMDPLCYGILVEVAKVTPPDPVTPPANP